MDWGSSTPCKTRCDLFVPWPPSWTGVPPPPVKRRSWEDYRKRGVTDVGGEWRTRARDTGEGDGSETSGVKEEENKKSTTSVDECFTPDLPRG